MELKRILSFGYKPEKNSFQNFKAKILGHPNLLKRINAQDYMKLIAPQPGEIILDFGCGAQHFSREMARDGAHVYACDIVGKTTDLNNLGKGKLKRVKIEPKPPLPFKRATFDKAFVADSVIYLKDPIKTFKDIKRVLKPGGKLILVHTLGRLQIKEAFKKNSPIIKLAQSLFDNAPKNYEEFQSYFFNIENGSAQRWLTTDEFKNIIKKAQFKKIKAKTSMPGKANNLLYWYQFFRICSQGKLNLDFGFLRHILLQLINHVSQEKDTSLLVLTAEK